MSEPTKLKAIAQGVFLGSPLTFSSIGIGTILGLHISQWFENTNTLVVPTSITIAALVTVLAVGSIFSSSRKNPGLYGLSTLTGTTILLIGGAKQISNLVI